MVILYIIKGIITDIADLLQIKNIRLKSNCLIVVRNLVSSKENKSHILTEKRILEETKRVLDESKSLSLLSVAVSLTFVFLYDSEKVICILK